jgi:hypothetical protein
MKKIPFFLVFILSFFVSNSQSDSGYVGKVKPFNAYIKTIDNKTINATLRGVNDSLMLVTMSRGEYLQIPAENIQSFTLKRKNSVGRGALIGFGIGAATGIIIGLASGDDPVYNEPVNDPFSGIFVSVNNAFAMSAGEKAVAGGLGLGLTGAIIGSITGALSKQKFIMGGKKETFRDLQSEIMKKLVRK